MELRLEIKLSQQPANNLAEWRVGVSVDDELVLILGFDRLSLMSDMVYVTMEPRPGLENIPIGAYRKMREMFDEIHGWKLFCQVPVTARMAEKWARFFGFRLVETELTDRLHYEKDTR